MVGLAWSNGPESCSGGSEVTVMASRARQFKGDDPDKKGYPGPPCWGFGVGFTTPHGKKLIVMKVEQRNKLDKFNDDGRKRTRYIYLVIARSLPAPEVLCIG